MTPAERKRFITCIHDNPRDGTCEDCKHLKDECEKILKHSKNPLEIQAMIKPERNGGGWWVGVRGLPDVVTRGATVADALTNIRIAVEHEYSGLQELPWKPDTEDFFRVWGCDPVKEGHYLQNFVADIDAKPRPDVMTPAERTFRQQYMLTFLANKGLSSLKGDPSKERLLQRAFEQSGIAWNELKDFGPLPFADYGGSDV